MASSTQPENLHFFRGNAVLSHAYILTVLRFTQHIYNDFYQGTISSAYVATEMLPTTLRSLQRILYRYDNEMSSQANYASDTARRILTSNEENSEKRSRMNRLRDHTKVQAEGLRMGFQYIWQMMECVGHTMDMLDDTVIGVEEQMRWEDIRRYFNDVDEEVIERIERLRSSVP